MDVQAFLVCFLKDRSATTAIEYGLIVSGIVVVIIAIIPLIGASIVADFEAVNAGLQ